MYIVLDSKALLYLKILRVVGGLGTYLYIHTYAHAHKRTLSQKQRSYRSLGALIKLS